MARSPLTETYKRVQGMVFYVQENLSSDEYMLFLDMVDPQPEPEAPKQTRKKRTTKTPKLTGLPKAGSEAAKGDAGNAASTNEDEGPMCVACGHPADYMDHTGPSPAKHDFEAPKVKKASAQK